MEWTVIRWIVILALVNSRLIGEPSGVLDKSLDGCENSNIFFWCEIFISEQKFINI